MGVNPLEDEYQHLFDNSDRFPARHAMILWNEDEAGVHDFVVALRPIDLKAEAREEAWRAFNEWQRQFRMSDGNCIAGWMGTDPELDCRARTPENVFGNLLMRGSLKTPEQIASVLIELSKLREAEWARQMIARWLRQRDQDEQ
jgi:hypothetical protein